MIRIYCDPDQDEVVIESKWEWESSASLEYKEVELEDCEELWTLSRAFIP